MNVRDGVGLETSLRHTSVNVRDGVGLERLP